MLLTYKRSLLHWVWTGMQHIVWTTSWSAWQTTTLQRQRQSTNHRTHSVLSSVALWLLLPKPPSSVRRRLRDFVTSLCKALTQWLRRCASLKSTCMPEVSSKQVQGVYYIAADQSLTSLCYYAALILSFLSRCIRVCLQFSSVWLGSETDWPTSMNVGR